MKKKFVVALVAAMSLTVAGTGTVFAMDKVSTVASEKEHVHGDNCEWVVDKPAWTETVEHPEEGHWEEVVVQEAWDEEVTRIGTFCHNCGFEIHSIDEWIAHSKASNGQCMSYGDKEVTEIIHHEAVVENQWVVDKEAWTETVEHPEEGHWVCNGEPQEPEQKPEQPEQPENPDQKPEQPEQPENPDQKPEQPENPDVETPETPEAENPETPEQKPEAPTTPEANKENVQTQATETKKEGTSPKTGDTTSALPVAGAGVASLGVALATILKKRK
ncbi:LPXTG cell wall anchor domain-containing protein [Mediterraneibacter gnavus]|uniref:LPXTG cell wall anchor domain-containing protein n=1 Tax=Mediterraneibacter gnavus TaxID=33038 RepID=UPI0022E0C4C6